MELLDTAVLVFFWLLLIVLSILSVWRVFRGQPAGYGQLSVLPESWRRWILDEKPKS